MSSKPPDDDTRTNNSDDDDDNFFCLGDAALYMQTTTFNTTGQKRWDAAVAMKEFLFDKAEEMFGNATEKKKICELGSGNGWLAMTMVKKFSCSIDTFYATEMDAGGALEWLNLILDMNREKGKLTPIQREKIYARSLDWNDVSLNKEDKDDERMSDIDFLLGSDLVYEESGVKMLPKVIAKLLSTRCKEPDAFMLYAHTKHRYDGMDVDFFENLEKEGLDYEEVRKNGTKTPPPSPPPFESLFPELRVAVFRICLRAE